ncbi:MAG: glycosyltransferase family 39 protein [Solibacillus sp.]
MQLFLNSIYTAIFYIIAIVAVTTVVKNSLLAGLLFVPLLIIGLYLLKYRNKISVEKHSNQIWIALQLLSAIFTLIMAFKLQVNLSWDWGQLIKTATFYVLNDEWDNLSYYARYPNNQFWLAILVYFFTMVKFIIPTAGIGVFKAATTLVGCILIQATIFTVYKTASLIWSKKKALVVGVITIACVPFYLYSQFAYTDLPALFLVALTCYLYVKTKSEQKMIWFIIFGIIAAVIFQIKVLSFIVFIALIMDYLITAKGIKGKVINTFCFLVVFVVVKALLSSFTAATVVIPEEYSDKYEFPATHWVMMGIHGIGSFDQNDVDYTASFSTYDEKVDATIERFTERVQEKGVAGVATHIFETKVIRTWGNPTYAGSDYAGRHSVSEDGVFQKFFTINGEWYWLYNIYASLYHIATLLGLLLVGMLSKKNANFLFMKTALIGIVVFLSIWECNSRYLLSFLPIIILLSCEGWFALMKRRKCI